MSSTYPSPSLNFYKHALVVTIIVMNINIHAYIASGSDSDAEAKGLSSSLPVLLVSFWLLNGFDNACSFEYTDSKLWMRFERSSRLKAA